jgi:hypothetical protein
MVGKTAAGEELRTGGPEADVSWKWNCSRWLSGGSCVSLTELKGEQPREYPKREYIALLDVEQIKNQ